MAGPYGRMCRDLFGQSLHIKGRLVLDDNAKLTVPNACVDYINVTGNVVTSGISEQEGQQGIQIIGNLCMDETFMLKTDTISETVPGNGVSIKNSVSYSKLGFGRTYMLEDQEIDKNGNAMQIIFPTNSYESTFTSTTGMIHPGADITKTFVVPDNTTINVPIGCTFGNVVVDTKIQIQANIFTGQFGDSFSVMLVNNSDTINPLSEYIYTVPFANASNTVQTISLSDTVKVAAQSQLDYYIAADNISTTLCANIIGGSHKSFATFNIISFEL